VTEPITPHNPPSGIRRRLASLIRQTSVARYWRLGDSPALRLWRNRILVALLLTAVLLHGLVDIHAQFEREVQARKRVNQQLEQATRLDALGRLAGGIAHDFNNILTAILAYVEFLKSRCGDDGEMIEDLDGIGESARRAAALTRQLLTFSREQDISVAATDMGVLLGAVEGMLQRLIREDIDLQIKPADDTWSAFGDRTQLEQVIVNLVVNAVDAIPGQGKIIIRTCNRNQTDRCNPDSEAVFQGQAGDDHPKDPRPRCWIEAAWAPGKAWERRKFCAAKRTDATSFF